MRISDWSSDVCSSDLDTRCTKSGFPDHFPCLRVKSPKITVRVSDKGKSAGGCERRSGERNALLHIPTLFHRADRSEEHTSELQSLMRLSYDVLCLKKKTCRHTITTHKSNTTTSHNHKR